jgi:hypothetical protein
MDELVIESWNKWVATHDRDEAGKFDAFVAGWAACQEHMQAQINLDLMTGGG